jgi:hypothetical protein
MKNYTSLPFKLIIFILCPLFSCEETIIEQEREGKVYTIEGFAQKGPYIVGTDVTVAELNDKLFPTGRVFFSTILDDKGRFALPGVVLESPYVQIKIRGFYYSEVWDNVTATELTLLAFADVRKSETINVNIITHLESERVAHLVQKENLSFDEAKTKAFKEFLAVFEWEDLDVASSETLDLSENDEGGAVLLAAACLFERSQGDYVKRLETITNFRIDFTDGKIDEPLTQNRLRSAASYIDRGRVLTNLENKYGSISFPDFGFLLDQFMQNSSYTDYGSFTNVFPESIDNKINLLRVTNDANLNGGVDYYVLINPPESVQNATLLLRIDLDDITSFSIEPDSDVIYFKDEYSSYGTYIYETNGNNWTQKSLPISITAGEGLRYGRLSYTLVIDGFIVTNYQSTFTY